MTSGEYTFDDDGGQFNDVWPQTQEAAPAEEPEQQTNDQQGWRWEEEQGDWAEEAEHDDDGSSVVPPSSAEGPRRTTRVKKRWRGGPPPPAPELAAYHDNVYRQPRMYQRWLRAVEMWKLRVRHYKPLAEAALDLLDAVKGDGALILEKISVERLYKPSGIELIIREMRVFDEVKVHRTGDILEQWESFRRADGVGLSKFIGQFLELESQCKERDLDVQRGQARAFKFLKSAALTADHQRHIMVEARDYDFDAIAKAMRNQWPRAVPPL